VVGVVADVRHMFWKPWAGPKCIGRCGKPVTMRHDLVVRTVLPPDRLAAGVRAALRPLDPNLPVREFTTLQGLVDKAVSPRRFLVCCWLDCGFALLLASLGIYAVISYS